MYLTLLNLLCSSISLISGQISYPDMRWSRCGRITEVGLYIHVAPSSGNISMNFNMPFKLILRRFDIVF